MGWLRLVGSMKLQVSFAKEPYKPCTSYESNVDILRVLNTHMGWLRLVKSMKYRSLLQESPINLVPHMNQM